AYYLKVVPMLSAGQIMAFEVLRYLGVIAAASIIRRRIDTTGARPFFLLTMVLYVFVAVFWWVFLRGQAPTLIGVYVAYFVLGLAAASWTVGNLNYLPKVTTADDRTLAVSIHGAVTACLGGSAPFIWGIFLKQPSAEGAGINTGVFQLFFIVVLISVIVLSSLLAKLPEDTTVPSEPLVIGNAVLRPFRAATYLVNLIDLRQVQPSAPPARPSSADAKPPP
ncbi:MAG TPA: MFS transporter, partial [Candidatus Synoicihabitans sp.]|nr:MFS transporter [Candidatus Synoicihabitans sp.]